MGVVPTRQRAKAEPRQEGWRLRAASRIEILGCGVSLVLPQSIDRIRFSGDHNAESLTFPGNKATDMGSRYMANDFGGGGIPDF